MPNLIDKIGDWNPQLFKELKIRCKKSQILIALIISFLPQVIIFLLEFEMYQRFDIHERILLEADSWWSSIFLSLNIIFIFTLLVAGSYLIINDLVKEERNGTLNFIRLSPQSEISIFIGKILGVPALIYLMVIATIPFHIFAGIRAKIPFGYILSFYLIVIASCIFFYSLASLFAIFGSNDFRISKAWFFCGTVLFYLFLSFGLVQMDIQYSTVWLRIFSPIEMHHYLFSSSLQESIPLGFNKLRFFNLPVSNNYISFFCLCLFNYAVATYWIWEGLKRCFRNPNSTLIGKSKSYLFVISFNLIHFGFLINGQSTSKSDFGVEVIYLYFWNIFLFLILIPLILPHRQTVQDWAAFRLHKKPSDKPLIKNSFISDLIIEEKSPANVAIAINLLISAIFMMLLTLFKGANYSTSDGIGFVIAVSICIVFFISLIMIYASIAQVILILKIPKAAFFAIGTTFAAITLPIIIVSVLSIYLSHTNVDTTLWLFTLAFPYAFVNTTPVKVIAVLLCQLAIIGLLNWNLFKLVQKFGESTTKAMFSESKAGK